VNIAVHFIRARSNLILSCFSGGFPMYIRCSVRRGEGERRIGCWGKEERVVGTVIVVYINFYYYFLRLTSPSIFDNRENGLLYFTYVVAVISV